MTKVAKKKKQKVTRGMPSAVLLSILIHVGLFLLAGALVVFTVVHKPEPKFEPPKAVERPKMKLKKPKVKIKKSSKPKSTTRIVTRTARATMPDMQLPEMSGMGDGLGGGVGGGFDLMPDLGEVTLLGSGQSIGNDLVGTLYDFKRHSDNRLRSCTVEGYRDEVRKFMKSGFNSARLSGIYKSPKKLYATTFVIPTVSSETAPIAFGEDEMGGNYWMAYYKGKLVHKEGITFRFVGSGDELIVVRVDGEIVFGSAWHSDEGQIIGDIWQTSVAGSKRYWLGNQKANLGDWVTLKPGVAVDIDIIMTDNGGQACLMLGVEEQGVQYEMRTVGGPIFPVFKTAELPLDIQDIIYKNMVANELCLTNGPVFCDYETAGPVHYPERNLSPEPPVEHGDEKPVRRTWTTLQGKTFEAEYITRVGDKVVLRDDRDKQVKIGPEELSPDDNEYIELINPPTLSMSVSHVVSPRNVVIDRRPVGDTIGYTYKFTGKVKQTSVQTYNRKLHVEYYAIGSEIHGNKYVLLDRQESSFVPGKENERSHRFSGPEVHVDDFVLENIHRGAKVAGFIILVTDERGKIVGYNSTAKWLYENLENLRKIPRGAFIDETCNRVPPTGPKRTRY